MQSVLGSRSRLGAEQDSSSVGQDLLKGVVHVLGLLELLIGPVVVEAKYRDPVLIYCIWVDLAVVFIAGNTFAPARHAQRGAVEPLDVFFQAFTIAAVRARVAKFILD